MVIALGRPHRETPCGFDEAQRNQYIAGLAPLTGLLLPRNIGTHTALEARWNEIVGRPAAQCQFTIVIPVHNERSIIARSLHSLIRSFLPSSLRAQVVIVSNGSTDGTPQLVDRLISRVAKMQPHNLPMSAQSPDVFASSTALVNTLQIVHLKSQKAGKLNALALATRLAEQRGDTFTICIDGDVFVEPETIARLVRDAYANKLGSPESDTVAVSGTLEARFPAKHSAVLSKLAPGLESGLQNPVPPAGYILGCCWAFSNFWFREASNRAVTVIEDTTLAADAFIHGKSIASSTAKAWSFCVASLQDYGRGGKRHAQGVVQSFARYSQHTDRLATFLGGKVAALAQPFGIRLKEILFAQLKTRPIRSWPFAILSFAFHEYFWRKGIKNAKRNPHAQTWEANRSTKGM